jgi:predicted Ser/Thr protein kinase
MTAQPDLHADELDPELVRRLGEALGTKYVVAGRLAQGGFSEILECCDMELDRRLAVKVLRPEIAWQHGIRARFKQEARALAGLVHPNIVPVHFIGETNGLTYYAMPYIPGRTLADYLHARGPLPARDLVPLLVPVLEALECAHRAGIVHRDIKPDNVIVEHGTGRPMLVDFGIAKCLHGATFQTQAGYVVGTPLYMSPEQALGRPDVDARADVYAFGAMAFQLLTGRPPFEGRDSQEIVGKHLHEPPPVASDRQPQVPGWLSEVVLRCLAKAPDQRFGSAADVASALRAGHAAEPTAPAAATPPSPLPFAFVPLTPVAAPVRRSRPVRYVAAAVAGIATALASLAFRAPEPTSVVVRNALVLPVRLDVRDAGAHVIPAGDSLRLAWDAGRRLEARWQVIRPEAGGRPVGEALAGRIVEEHPAGARRHVIDLQGAGTHVFAPRVTNPTGMPVTLAVEHRGARLCDCEVPAGAAGLALGYFPLAVAIRAHDAFGREADYDLQRARRDAGAGAVALQVRPLAPVSPAAPAPGA